MTFSSLETTCLWWRLNLTKGLSLKRFKRLRLKLIWKLMVMIISFWKIQRLYSSWWFLWRKLWKRILVVEFVGFQILETPVLWTQLCNAFQTHLSWQSISYLDCSKTKSITKIQWVLKEDLFRHTLNWWKKCGLTVRVEQLHGKLKSLLEK